MALKWTKTSAPPPSTSMKPKPFSPLNHLTVPCAITSPSISWSHLATADYCQTLDHDNAHANSQGRSTYHGSRTATAPLVLHTSDPIPHSRCLDRQVRDGEPSPLTS